MEALSAGAGDRMHGKVHSRDQLRPMVPWVGLREGKVRSQEEGGGGPSRLQEGIIKEGIRRETLVSKSHLGLPLNTGLGEADQTEGWSRGGPKPADWVNGDPGNREFGRSYGQGEG